MGRLKRLSKLNLKKDFCFFDERKSYFEDKLRDYLVQRRGGEKRDSNRGKGREKKIKVLCLV